jgi:hypothetical protein
MGCLGFLEPGIEHTLADTVRVHSVPSPTQLRLLRVVLVEFRIVAATAMLGVSRVRLDQKAADLGWWLWAIITPA